jgi:tRNA threonylcarbamoyladenosine biosynthesis protein TsaB
MILAIDSSIGTSVAVTDDLGSPLASRSVVDRRSHAEAIGPLISEALAEAGEGTLSAVVMGVGPGPFTGLRVGMAAAQAFAWGQELELWPVLSHDAAAWAITSSLAVVTDARRGEMAVTRYQPDPAGGLGRREGTTALVPAREAADCGGVMDGYPLTLLEAIDPVGLVRAALWYRSRGLPLMAPQAVYLRPPDVTMPQ